MESFLGNTQEKALRNRIHLR
jgi:hypothetical protein